MNLELDSPKYNTSTITPKRILILEFESPTRGRTQCDFKPENGFKPRLEQSVAALNYHGPLFLRKSSDTEYYS